MFGIGPAHALGNDPAEGVTHIGILRASREDRLHISQLIDHPVIIAHEFGRDALGHIRNAQAVAQRIPDGCGVFAVRCKLGPVARNRRIILNQAPFSLEMERGGRGRLDDREGGEERIPIDCSSSGLVGNTTPDIHDLLAIEIHCDLHPKLAVLPDRGCNGLLKNAVCLWFTFRRRCHGLFPLFSG